MFDVGWNSRPLGADTYVLSTWVFLRLLGLIYLIAFVSLGVQVRGLIGSRGVLPVGADFPAAVKYARFKLFLRRPTIFLWNNSDTFVTASCVMGAVLSVLLIIGVAPMPVLVLLWLLYLLLLHACGLFLGYQWDVLLLETGFLAIFLAPLEALPALPPAASPSPVAHALAVWLLFRLIFSSGAVKLRSGDPTWRNLTALRFHYETQPLPNRVSWYAHHRPLWFQKLSTTLTLLIELVVPFGVFFPPPVNYTSVGIIAVLMLLIIATGSYGFFNLLALALCVVVVDDAAAIDLMRGWAPGWQPPPATAPPPIAWEVVIAVVGVLLLALSLDPMVRLMHRAIPWPGFIRRMLDRFRPFLLVNSYGLFANMTTTRPEIIVEGSHDGTEWKAYEFKWKPGDPRRPPRQAAPHQPRLDWQMWFAALGHYRQNPWFIAFLARLLEGSPDVLKLLKTNPFPGTPPSYVRALLYDYHFTTPKERRETGAWWRRELLGLYCPTLTSKPQTTPYCTPPPE